MDAYAAAKHLAAPPPSSEKSGEAIPRGANETDNADRR